MSVAAGHRLAPGGGFDRVDEAVEQIQRIVRSGTCLGVVLDGGAGNVAKRQTLDGAVVEVDVGQLGGAEIGLPPHGLVVLDRPRAPRAEHCEAVVLAGDLGPPRGQVLDRMVGPVVAERQLVGLQADGPAQQLVAEADAVHRAAGRPVRGRSRRCSRARPGSPGPLARNTASGSEASSSSWPALHGCSVTVGAAGAEIADDRELDAGIDHGDSEAGFAGLWRLAWRPTSGRREHDRLTGGHLAGEVAAGHRRLGVDQLAGLRLGDPRREHPAAHRAAHRGCGAPARACRGR